ncbi:SDR family oxidoreductase [Aggregicoccus sp. 17bor-14]|uniref:SDR family NAD(P)-dependent oxidoreductase n=1 Tax=Myxococcaceae TaxID=31 RepID=UPI00129D0132|nr:MULTISPECIES: SDR family oxidoreductase [Myxococcaceae]MBF5044836.1 SDR family oxidoreductase [Simulacricoccus sp. 17bor-14]MRI90580.1 SDR family oxidoreductase [Aggregicoccus sp. 17bor-14]
MTDKQVMLITGSRKGIGRHLAETYARRGFIVEGCSRGEAGWEAENYTHHQVDVADERQVKAMISNVAKRHGRIDVVLNNAAIATMNHVLLTPAATANRMLEVNVTGTMLVCRDAAKVMMRRRYGRIVNFTTIVAPIALAGEAIYAASKSAVVTFTRILAFELGQWGITCNSFGATPIMTDMIKGVPQDKIDAVVNGLAIKRLGTPEDCVNVCDFFISPSSDNITGQVIYLGGVT